MQHRDLRASFQGRDATHQPQSDFRFERWVKRPKVGGRRRSSSAPRHYASRFAAWAAHGCGAAPRSARPVTRNRLEFANEGGDKGVSCRGPWPTPGTSRAAPGQTPDSTPHVPRSACTRRRTCHSPDPPPPCGGTQAVARSRVWSGSGCVRVCFVRALVDLQPTSALVERRVRAYLHSSELDDFSYPWPDTQSGCQSVRVCKALRGGVRTSASTSRIG